LNLLDSGFRRNDYKSKSLTFYEAIRNMLDRYECRIRDDYVNALREILLKPSNGLFQFNMRLIVDDKRKNAPLQI